MKWATLLLATAACTSADVSTLTPVITAQPNPTGLTAMVDLGSGDAELSASATFRGTTRRLERVAPGSYVASFELETPLAADEPVAFDVDGVEMTVTAPAPFPRSRAARWCSGEPSTTRSHRRPRAAGSARRDEPGEQLAQRRGGILGHAGVHR